MNQQRQVLEVERFKLVPVGYTGEVGTGITEPQGVWKCHMEVYYFIKSVLFPSLFFMCDRICCMHVFGFFLFLHICACTCVHAYGGPSLISEIVLNCFSTSFIGDRVCQSNPQLAGMATLANQLALELLSSPPSEAGITGRPPNSPKLSMGFWGSKFQSSHLYRKHLNHGAIFCNHSWSFVS